MTHKFFGYIVAVELEFAYNILVQLLAFLIRFVFHAQESVKKFDNFF